MRIRHTKIALIYLRRSNSRNELSLAAQLDWALGEVARRGLTVEATQGDLEFMIENRLSSYKSLRIDDGISGAEMDRPGFQAVLRDVSADRSISHVLSYRRDRLARPEDALQMATIERDIRKKGVTFIFNDKVAEPLDISRPDLADLITIVVEYNQNGDELRKTAERVLDAQRLLAKGGHSTGGNAPFGFVRVLVDASGREVEELAPGRRIRQAGCHVRWIAKDRNKIAIWILILDLKHQGWGAKRIANHLNALAIPSPNAGRIRKDHGVKHCVSGKWDPRSVLELCRNTAILGLKEYGQQSEGRHRRFDGDGYRTVNELDRNESNRPKAIRNDASMVISAKVGEELYDAQKWEEIQRITDERGKSQKGIQRSADQSKYPLSCRVIDLADGCGNIMYGRQSGQRKLYSCGRYMRTSSSECNNNSVDAEALTRVVLNVLQQCINSSGGLEPLRQRFENLAKTQSRQDTPSQSSQEISVLTKRVAQLRSDQEAVVQNMSRERDQDRYQAMAGEFDRIKNELRNAEQRLVALESRVPSAVSIDQEVEAAMMLASQILRITEDPAARADIGPLLKKLKLWIGLDFTSVIKGKKRSVRRLSGGVIMFGQDQPPQLHGKDRVADATQVQRTSNPKKKLLTLEHDEFDDPDLSLGTPNTVPSHPKEISFTKVSRGDWI